MQNASRSTVRVGQTVARLGAATIALSGLLWNTSAASAAVFIVNTFQDTQDTNPGDGIAADANGNTSLRAAIMEANALPGPHQIHLPLAGVYSLSLFGAGEDLAATGDLDILVPMQIFGTGPLNTIIDASPCPLPHPCPGHDRAFDIYAADVELGGMTIRNAYAPVGENGGGVRRNTPGVVRFFSVEFQTCRADNGGAVHSTGGPIEMHFCKVEACGATFNGGGIYLDTDFLLGVGSEFIFNQTSTDDGGAIFTQNNTTLLLDNCFLLANVAEKRGGAVAVGSNAQADFVRTNFLENSAALGGGVRTGGITRFFECELVGNFAVGPPLGIALGTAGGGIFATGRLTEIIRTAVVNNIVDSNMIEDAGGGMTVDLLSTVNVIDSTFQNNVAGGLPGLGRGGAIAVLGQLNVVNSTLSGNLANQYGGALFNYPIAQVNFSHVTVARNHAEFDGGGIFHDGAGGNMLCVSSLIAENTITVNPGPPPLHAPQNCAFSIPGSSLASAGYNLDDDGTCGFAGAGDLVAPAGISSLANNGGPTMTHALNAGSRAIDAAAPNCADLAGNVLVADQRGVARPQGAACDIGAYEFVGLTICGQPVPGPYTIEPEPCGASVNDGCNVNPPAFTPITCNSSILGTSWYTPGSGIDTDWYTIDVQDLNGDGQSQFTVTLFTAFDANFRIVNDDCANLISYGTATAAACTAASLGAIVPSPGTYRIIVFPVSGSPVPVVCGADDTYLLTVDVDDCCTAAAPANDDCPNALNLATNIHMFDNVCATTDGPTADTCGLPPGVQHESDVWFTFTPPCTGSRQVLLWATSGAPGRLLGVYTDCPQAGGVLLSCGVAPAFGNLAIAQFPGTAGQTYYIRAGGINGVQGGSGLQIESCAGDVAPQRFGDCIVNASDLLTVINNWGFCPPPCPPFCPGDINHDCVVNANDLLIVINSWGVCP